MSRTEGHEIVQIRPPSGHSTPRAVVRAIASATDKDPVELPPVCESLELEELSALVSEENDLSIEFDHAGCTVTVDGDTVTVNPD